MLETFGYISGILFMFSAVPYVRSILKGNTKPQRITWLIWTVLVFIAFFSQLAKGATWSLLLTAGDAVTIVIVFIFSIKYGIGGFGKMDIISLFGAGLSLVLWYFTNEPAIALFLIIFIDIIGSNLTIIKTWKNPETENWVGWAMCGVGGVFGILSVGSFNFILLAYPLYICLINSLIALIILIRSRILKKNNEEV